MRRIVLATAAIACLSMMLTGCGPSRKAADQKLSGACLAAVKAISDSGDTIELQNATFGSEKQGDIDLRTVVLDAQFSHDRGIISEKTYTCTFEEHSGVFGYKPEFYSMEKDGQKYGNFDGTIQGDLDTMTRINNAVTTALF
jgi:hypothetical protein